MVAPSTLPAAAGAPEYGRGVYCNRTLNLRAIRALGFDMDYTLIHYNVDAWEQRAYDYLQQRLLEQQWPVGDLRFDPSFAMRGLVIDTELGNLVKADRFGYVKRAYHGLRRLEFEEQRQAYARALVDLDEPRWVFLNTFFSLSEAGMYAQLVEALDERRLPAAIGYADLWRVIRRSLDQAHAEGRLKAEIIERPDLYVELDPEVALALRDQKSSGKKLLLITNSEWQYTRDMMAWAFDRFLDGAGWRSLFDLVIVAARKPEFFSGHSPVFELASDEGLLRPMVAGPTGPGVYLGGNAALVETWLGLSESEILYVGDHLYTDVRASKDVRRWRTCLIARELEDELSALASTEAEQQRLDRLMAEKSTLEYEQARYRLQLQRVDQHYGPPAVATTDALEARLGRLRARLERLDDEIAPLATHLGSLYNDAWGPLMSAGADQSYLARQLETSADLYTSRVSNFLHQTPFAYMRAPRGRMPHDAALEQGAGGVERASATN